MRKNAEVWSVAQYGEFVELALDEITGEKIEEAKAELLNQAKHIAEKLVEQNIEYFIKDWNIAGNGYKTVGYKTCFAVRRDDESLDDILDGNKGKEGVVLVRDRRDFILCEKIPQECIVNEEEYDD